MNKKLLGFLPLLLLFLSRISAQVAQPCGTPPPPGAESCPAACVYCDFDGYTGTNNGTPSGGNTVCGQIALHNDQWFGFTAGSTSITIDILNSNCVVGDGLQAAFFAACDEDAITCNPGSQGGGGSTLTLSYGGFVEGQTYFLMIDGWSGDECDFEIDIVDGSITPPPPDQAAQPVGPTQVCPGATVVYSIPPAFGAGSYSWTAPAGSSINGGGAAAVFQAPDGTEVTITFGTSGGNVCVQTDNACFPPAPSSCLQVTNKKIPDTVKPPKVICFNDAPYEWDETPATILTAPGTYNLTSQPYDSYLGCDSIVKQTITIKPQISSNMGIKYICKGSCFNFNGNNYCLPGSYNDKLTSFQGCDSIVNFTIIVIDPVAVIAPTQQINCNNPVLTLNSAGSSSGNNVSYSWTNATWSQIGTAATQNVSTGGTYHLIVTQLGGTQTCKDTATVTVTSNVVPPGVTATGGAISCINPSVQLTANSTTNNVNYAWSGPDISSSNQFQQNPTVTIGGTYTVTVTNPANNCTSIASVDVSSDKTAPSLSVTGGTINCNVTSVTLVSSTNANSPTYNWTGPGINPGNQGTANPTVNLSGSYGLTITNPANGCTNSVTTIIQEDTSVPTVDAGADQAVTCTTPVVVLVANGSASGSPSQFTWSGPGINASNQNNTSIPTSLGGTYILTHTNTQNLCSKSDTVVVTLNNTSPNAVAGADQTINCLAPNVTLNTTGSSQGANITPTWTGPGITASNINSYNPTVGQPGTYNLLITNMDNGCTATDVVVVNLDITAPSAGAGVDQTITCSNPNGVTLNGTGTPAGVTFLWTGPGIGANNETQQSPVITQPGTYILTVTNPVNGCTDTDQAIISQDAGVPTASAGPDLTLNCTVASVNIDASSSTQGAGIVYQWTGPGAFTSTVLNPQNITVPGTYNLTVTNNNNNCKNQDVMVVLIDTIKPTADAGAALILNCYNNSIDTLDASASSTGANFQLTWAGPGITPANANSANPVINNQPGLYTLTVLNTDNNCTSTDQVNVASDVAAPTADAGADKVIDCVVLNTTLGGASSTGANFSYEWTGPGLTQPATTATINVDQAGAYDLVVTNQTNGCTSVDQAVVNTDAEYPTVLAGPDDRITCAKANIILDGSASSSGSGFNVQWSGPGINAGNQAQLSPTVTVPGTYVLQITNTTNSCIETDTAIVTENVTLPTVDVPASLHLDCKTTSVVLDGKNSSAGPTITYLWTGPDITAGNEMLPDPTVALPGTYNIVVSDSDNGCTATGTVAVTQDIAIPTANAGVDLTLTCTTPSQNIDGSASSTGVNFKYVWEGPDIATSNFDDQSPLVSKAGTYTVTVTNTTNHCTQTDEVVVAADQTKPVTSAGNDQTLTCTNDTLTLDGALSATGPNIQYQWSGTGIVAGQENLASPQVFVPGTYVITVTNVLNGCTNTDAVTVGENKIKPVVNAGADQVLTCANATTGVSLSSAGSDAGAGFGILWSGPGISAANQNQAGPTVLATGNYTLQITNTATGCTSTDEVAVIQDQNLPTAAAGLDQTITCETTQVTLDGSGSTTPNGTLTYNWAGPGITSANQNSDKPLVSTAGTYTLTVINTLTGCQNTDNVVVLLDNQPPVVTVTSTMITCAVPSATVTGTSSVPGSTYYWEGPSVTQQTQDDPKLTVTEPGLYSLTVTAPNGCTAVQNTTVTQDANVPDGIVETAANLNCANGGQTQLGGKVTSANATFKWTGPGGFNSTLTNPTVTQAGTYNFVITSQAGCTKSIPVVVVADFNPPAVNAAALETIDCNTPSVSISTSGTAVGPNFSYVWSTVDGNIVSGGNGLNPLVNRSGTYKLVVTNNINGCKDSTEVDVIKDPAVPNGFDMVVNNIPCFGEKDGSIVIEGIFGGTPPFIYTVENSDGDEINQFVNLGAGQYTVSLEDANGCRLDTTVNITSPNKLEVELGDEITVQLGDSAYLKATIVSDLPVTAIRWSYFPDEIDTDASYKPLSSYRHHITVVDENGCIATDEVDVIVRKDRLVYVPTIFNPKASNVENQTLNIFTGKGVTKVRSWLIFDRWGSAVFEVKGFDVSPGSPDPNYGWDGRVRGKEGDTGVYVWYAEIEFEDGHVEIYKGDVTLMR